jgi:hypothetical protein
MQASIACLFALLCFHRISKRNPHIVFIQQQLVSTGITFKLSRVDRRSAAVVASWSPLLVPSRVAWPFRCPTSRYVFTRTQQLSRWSHAGLLVRREVLESSPWLVLHEHDRYFYVDPTVLDPSLRVRLMAVHHVDQRPMVHHYSQVSHEVHVVTMEGMLSRTCIFCCSSSVSMPLGL